MDDPVVYADLNISRTLRPKHAPTPALRPDARQCPRDYQLTLKLGYAGLFLLVTSVIGLSVFVQFLKQKPPAGNSHLVVPQNRTETSTTTERPSLPNCPVDWHPYEDKCLYFSQTSKTWTESLADCSAKEATLLLIQGQELRFIKDMKKNNEKIFWIGLTYTSEKTWKWINGSKLNCDILNVTGDHKENSCAHINNGKVLSEYCTADNFWICQKVLQPSEIKSV